MGVSDLLHLFAGHALGTLVVEHELHGCCKRAVFRFPTVAPAVAHHLRHDVEDGGPAGHHHQQGQDQQRGVEQAVLALLVGVVDGRLKHCQFEGGPRNLSQDLSILKIFTDKLRVVRGVEVVFCCKI